MDNDAFAQASKLTTEQQEALKSMRHGSAYVSTIVAAGLVAMHLARSTRRPGRYKITAHGAMLADALVAGYDWRTRMMAPLAEKEATNGDHR